MTTAELKQRLDSEPTVPLWPVAGKALGKTRGGSYDARKRGDLDAILVPGGPPYRCASAKIKKLLGWE